MIKLKEVIKNKSQWIELNTYIELIENNQDENPNITLDGAKSLLETVSKTILEDKGIEYVHDENISKLIKTVFDTIHIFTLLEARDSQSAKAILGAFSTITKHIGEFRNRHGFFSHGQDIQSNKFDRYLVELVISSADLVTSFLITAHSENLKDRVRSYYDENDEFNRYINDIAEPLQIFTAVILPAMALYTDKDAYKGKLNGFLNDKDNIINLLETVTPSFLETFIEENLIEFQLYFTDEESLKILNTLYKIKDNVDFKNTSIKEFIKNIVENLNENLSTEFQIKIDEMLGK